MGVVLDSISRYHSDPSESSRVFHFIPRNDMSPDTQVCSCCMTVRGT